MPERHANDEHSYLMVRFVNYKEKSIENVTRGAYTVKLIKP
jgi:hypothetical protein